MSMHVNLPEEMEAYIKSKVAGGFYANATDVIRDAIRRMHAEDDYVTVFQAAVDEGEAELDRGEGIVGTETTINDIAAEVLANRAKLTRTVYG